MSFEERLIAHFNKPRPTISEIAGVDWKLNEAQIERATEIVKVFTTWVQETGPCPISPTDQHWFKRLCALAEWIAILEGEIDPERFVEPPEEED